MPKNDIQERPSTHATPQSARLADPLPHYASIVLSIIGNFSSAKELFQHNRFNFEPIHLRSHERSHERPHERSHERSHEGSHEVT